VDASGLGPAALSAPRLVPDSVEPVALRPMPAGVRRLAGFCVAIATDVRRHDLAALLDAEGARTTGITAVRTVPQPDPDAIAAAVRACVDEPMDEVIVSSAFGLRAWLDAASKAGHLEALIDGFGRARLLARDARAADGLRALGFTQIWSTAAATTEDLFRYLFAQPVSGRRVVAHIESDAERELCEHLRQQGAGVVEVPTTHAMGPKHPDVLRRLCDLIARHQVDAVAFLGPPTTTHLLDQAARDGVLDDVLNALVEHVAAVCLGPLTAAPLRTRGIPVIQAVTPVTEALAARIVDELPRRSMVLEAGRQRLEVRGQAVVLGDRLIPVQPGPLAVLRVLAARPGRVMSTTEILAAMPGPSTVDDHAIEMAVSRLRSTLGSDPAGRDLVQTVMRRGYRLAV
jgi:uroporphyrinogen-III synthase